MKKRGRNRPPQRCVCGQPITHPPILPGERSASDKPCPPDVETKGHTPHAFSYYCICGYCLSLA